jgi:hypothetical protein
MPMLERLLSIDGYEEVLKDCSCLDWGADLEIQIWIGCRIYFSKKTFTCIIWLSNVEEIF